MKFYIYGWLLVHLFLAAFMGLIYACAGVPFVLSEVLKAIAVLFSIEFIIIGFMILFYKLAIREDD